jgi:hypothetical protein
MIPSRDRPDQMIPSRDRPDQMIPSRDRPDQMIPSRDRPAQMVLKEALMRIFIQICVLAVQKSANLCTTIFAIYAEKLLRIVQG